MLDPLTSHYQGEVYGINRLFVLLLDDDEGTREPETEAINLVRKRLAKFSR